MNIPRVELGLNISSRELGLDKRFVGSKNARWCPGLEDFAHDKGITGSKVCPKELPKTRDLPGL